MKKAPELTGAFLRQLGATLPTPRHERRVRAGLFCACQSACFQLGPTEAGIARYNRVARSAAVVNTKKPAPSLQARDGRQRTKPTLGGQISLVVVDGIVDFDAGVSLAQCVVAGGLAVDILVL